MTRPASKTLTPPTGGQVCALFAVDIAGFTRPDRDDDIRLFLHEELYRILERAFDGSGIPWNGCFLEDRGDGALVIVPPAIAAGGIIDPLPERLGGLIRRHNHVSCKAARIQLRAAAHLGPVYHDGHGFIGSDVDFLFRMLDARPLKSALGSTDRDLALIVSDYVYRSIVCRHPSLVSPDAFRPIRFQVKYARARAWTYLPDAPHSLAMQRNQSVEVGAMVLVDCQDDPAEQRGSYGWQGGSRGRCSLATRRVRRTSGRATPTGVYPPATVSNRACRRCAA